MSKSNETLNSIKELLGLATPKEVVEEINLAEEVVDEVKEVKEEPKKEMEQPNYVTEQQLSEVKNELFLMIQALLEENKKQVKEVPQELAKVEEVSEIVHSPENEVEKKQVNFSKSVVNMTPQERIYAMLNNK